MTILTFDGVIVKMKESGHILLLVRNFIINIRRALEQRHQIFIG